MRDIVYILKNDIQPDELRYSLRSVCENFPHRNIVFVGGCPEGISCDVYIPHQQRGLSKWERSTSSLRKVCLDESISDEFFLFNDDFYILKPVDTNNFINFTDGTLDRRVTELERNLRKTSSYAKRLKATIIDLKRQNKDTISFAVHMPFLINKRKALELIDGLPGCSMFRSLYGNFYNVPYIYHKDVKIYTNDKLPEFDDYLSTADDSFKNGLVGEYIKKRFPYPCRHELIGSRYVNEIYTEEGDERYLIEPILKGE